MTGPGDRSAEPTGVLPARGARAAQRRGVVHMTAGSEVGLVVPVDATAPVTLGRADDCTVRVADPGLSRVHARVAVVDGVYVLADLGSTNGTFVNDKRVEGSASLADGDRVRLGGATVFRFSLVDEEEERALTRLYASARGRDDAAKKPEPDDALVDAGRVVRDVAMRALYEQAMMAARASISVLLLGETGVGKEVLARAIHLASPRADRPFLALNCAALAESLLESELFGHERGAFTGAASARPGLFESADGGTVFLDEVGELPMSIQVKLLRVLEDKRVLRVGARAPVVVDVRFISATNRDLEAAVSAGRFRRDLYFRLDGMSLSIPPLRERTAEIEELAHLFASRVAREIDRVTVPSLAPEVLAILQSHAWPGNVRELRNVIERAVILCKGDHVLPEHLPQALLAPPVVDAHSARLVPGRVADPAALQAPAASPSSHGDAVPVSSGSGALKTEKEALERQRIAESLERCGGNQTKAAKLLGISRRTLTARLDQFGFDRPRKKRT